METVSALVRFKSPALVGARNFSGGEQGSIPAGRAFELVEMGLADPVGLDSRDAIRQGGQERAIHGRPIPKPYAPRQRTPDEGDAPDAVEIQLKEPLLVGTRNVAPGEKVRVSPDRAAILIEKGLARIADPKDMKAQTRVQESTRRRSAESARLQA